MNWPSTGGLFITVKDASGNMLLARTAATQDPATSGQYHYTLTANNIGWDVLWDDGGSGPGHSLREWYEPQAQAAAPVNLSVDETEVISS